MNIVAVTSCITGIAHTYMAAEALEQAAKRAGHTIAVETQGSAGSTPIKQSVIDAADVVIFAADLEVKQRSRFNGKPVLRVGVSKALSDADNVVAEAVKSATDGTAEIVGAGEAAQPAAAPKAEKPAAGEKKGFFGKLFG
ncbi:MAG TPA: PTS fructose transporter subunit IIB [Microbacteriaceae bacterium]|nr:PTS fructose transporter subunit IIB [Microbacteriaceae bacterium]